MPGGRLVQHIWSSKENKTKEFTINAAALARYYWTHFESGVLNMQMKVEGTKENAIPGGGSVASCEKAHLTFWFANGVQVRRRRCIDPRLTSAVDMVWPLVSLDPCWR